MTPFEAFQLATSVKLHFTVDSYDYFRYLGKSNLKLANFETRNDKYHYYRLSKQPDPLGLLVASYVDGKPGWIGNLWTEPSMKVYREWNKRREGLSYTFKVDIGKLPFPPDSALRVFPGSYPMLLKMLQRKEVCIETVIILNDVLSFFPYWDKKIEDTVIWPSIRRKCIKYRPFVDYNPDRIKDIIASL